MSKLVQIVDKTPAPWSRSAVKQATRCERRALWEYLYRPDDVDLPANFEGGIRPAYQSVPLMTGTAVHEGIAEMLKKGSVRAGWDKADKIIGRQIELGLDAIAPPHWLDTGKEQLAITKGLIMAYGTVAKASLEADCGGTMMAVEEEIKVPLGRTVFWSKPDAAVEGIGGDIIVSIKTCGAYGAQQQQDSVLTSQHLSEAIGWKYKTGTAPAGVVMVFLVKGIRKDNPEYGRKITLSPFAYPYTDGQTWTPETITRKGWRKAFVGEYPNGMDEWLKYVNVTHSQEVRDRVKIPPPVTVLMEYAEEWLEEGRKRWEMMLDKGGRVNDYAKNADACNDYFSSCPYKPMCWGALADNKDNPNGLGFVPREPHHVEDVEEVL